MLDSALSAVSDRLDSNFLTAFWLPAFVAVLANVGLLAVLVGPATLMAGAADLDAIEQTFLAVLASVTTILLALLLRALALVIVAFFAGETLPRLVAEWSTRGQHRARTRALRPLGDSPSGPSVSLSAEEVRRLFEQRFPRDETALRPTRLGNMLMTATEYPRIVYAMDGLLWWPLLMPLLPDEVRKALEGAQAALLGLLNLSLILVVVAGEAILGLGIVGHQWTAALGVALGGVAGAWLCYRAATNQVLEVAGLIRVAFTLYRHSILTQLNRAIPDDIAAEHALWQALSLELLGHFGVAAPTGDGTETADRPNG